MRGVDDGKKRFLRKGRVLMELFRTPLTLNISAETDHFISIFICNLLIRGEEWNE